MPAQTFTITGLNTVMHPGFTIKQVKIENPTPFTLYLNISTNVPTNVSSDYTIQPNSTLITPATNNTDACLVASGLNVSKGVAKVTVYDTASQQAGSIPYQSAQFVGNFPNYPYVIPASELSSQFTLPDINIDKFQTIFIQMIGNPNLGLPTPKRPVLVAGSQIGVGSFPIGGFSIMGGVVSVIPKTVPYTLTPVLDISNDGVGYEKIFNVIQTNDPIEINYTNPNINGGAANGGTYVQYGYYTTPGFVFSLRVSNNKAGTFLGIFTVVVSVRDIFDVNFCEIFNSTYNITLSNFTLVNVLNKVFLLAGIGEVKIAITNNSGATNDLVIAAHAEVL